MTQTDVIQQIRDTVVGPTILRCVLMALQAEVENGDPYMPKAAPMSVPVWVYYNEFGIVAVKHLISYIPSNPTVLIQGDLYSGKPTWEVYYTGQAKVQANDALAHHKVVGIKFCADGKVKFIK